MKFKEIFLLLLLACMTCFSVTSCDKGNEQQQPQDDENTCTVTLVGDEHVNLPKNPTVTVEKGESVSFSVTVDEGFVLTADRDDVEIKRKSITVSNVQDDITVTLTSNPAYRFTATTTNAVYGRVSASVNSGWVIANSDITLEAIANKGKKFIGWSKNYPMVDGGKIYSFDTSVSLKLNEDTTLYANFTNEETVLERLMNC